MFLLSVDNKTTACQIGVSPVKSRLYSLKFLLPPPILFPILYVQAPARAEYKRKGNLLMERKTDKELAVEAAIEYIKSWNAAERTAAAKVEDFTHALEEIYSTIRNLDNM